MKYLIIILVIVALWLLLRQRKGREPAARTGPASRKAAQPQPMVQCSHCGVHLARADALAGDGGMFCSEAHRLAGPRPS